MASLSLVLSDRAAVGVYIFDSEKLSFIKDLQAVGVEFVFNTYIGKDKTIDALFEDGYEAIFVGVGTQVDAPLKVEGADLPGVYPATEFLIRTNVREHYLPQDMPPLRDVGEKVVVIGAVEVDFILQEIVAVVALQAAVKILTGFRGGRYFYISLLINSYLKFPAYNSNPRWAENMYT